MAEIIIINPKIFLQNKNILTEGCKNPLAQNKRSNIVSYNVEDAYCKENLQNKIITPIPKHSWRIDGIF